MSELPFYKVDRQMAGSVARPHIWQPSENTESSRTLLLLHGTGADEHDLIGLGKLLDPTANLLSPRGLVVHQGMARHFLRHDSGEFDEDGIRANSDDLAAFVADAAREYGFDSSKVWGAGFSNGATALNALMLQHPELLQGIFAFGTTRSFKGGDFSNVDLTGKHVFIGNGAQDDYSPADEVAELVGLYQQLGAQVKLRVHPGGHTIVIEHVREFASDLLGIDAKPA